MSDNDWESESRGRQPGADVGDDRDVPDDPLLGPPSEDEPADVAEPSEPVEEREDEGV